MGGAIDLYYFKCAAWLTVLCAEVGVLNTNILPARLRNLNNWYDDGYFYIYSCVHNNMYVELLYSRLSSSDWNYRSGCNAGAENT